MSELCFRTRNKDYWVARVYKTQSSVGIRNGVYVYVYVSKQICTYLFLARDVYYINKYESYKGILLGIFFEFHLIFLKDFCFVIY